MVTTFAELIILAALSKTPKRLTYGVPGGTVYVKGRIHARLAPTLTSCKIR